MFILTSDQVDYCVLSRHATNPTVQTPGLEYQRKLYVKGETFSYAHRQLAIERARMLLLDRKGKAVLLVENGENLTLWCHDEMAQKLNSASTINLQQLVSAMRTVGGVPIKERQFRLKSYPQCFVGSEAVDWLVSHLNISRQQAIQVGQRLIDDNWIHHVVDEQPFQDDYFFYRFRWDEQ